MFNPYQAFMPFRATSGLGILGRINWGTLLSNAQKSLSIVNQAIPIVYQVKPIVSNARTVFKVVNELGKPNKTNTNTNTNTKANNINTNESTPIKNSSNQNYSSNEPVFFI